MTASLSILVSSNGTYESLSKASGLQPWLVRNVTSRVANLAAVIAAPLSSAVELPLGALMGVGVMFTVGRVKELNVSFGEYFGNSLLGLAAFPYAGLVRTINPGAEFDFENKTTIDERRISLGEKALDFSLADGFVKRHIVSRLYMLGKLALGIAERIAFFVISIFTVPLSILTLGKFDTLNTLSFKGLALPLLVAIVWTGVIQVLNPKAEF